MSSRQFTQYILGLVFLATSSLALSNTEFTYNVIDGGIEVTGCAVICPSELAIPEEIDGYSVKSIGDSAFTYSYPKLSSVSIPDSVTHIKPWAFMHQEISNLTLGDNLTVIADSAFAHNQLSNVTLPESLLKISTWAFAYNQLTNVNIPDNIEFFGEGVFVGNPNIISGDWQYHIFSNKAVITGCAEICPANLIIPEEIDGYPVDRIGYEAFLGKQLTNVSIPDTVTSIEFRAFAGNPSADIALPDSVRNISSAVFHNNNNIISGDWQYYLLSNKAVITGCADTCPFDLIIPQTIDGYLVDRIGFNAFNGNELSSVNIPETVSYIEVFAFSNNELTHVIIPDSVTDIDFYAFKGNDSLTTITIPENVKFMGDESFSGSSLENITFLGHRPEMIESLYGDNLSEIYYCSGASGWPGETINNIAPQLDNTCFYQNGSYAVLDIDQNGSFDALTDGLILLRYAFGLRGETLTGDVIGANANRTTAAEIEVYIQSLVP